MNAEIFKMRENIGLKDVLYCKPIWKNNPNDNSLKILESMKLKSNMSKLYSMGDNVKLEDYIKIFTENIYIILDVICSMNIYPDYFFDITFQKNVDNYRLNKGRSGKDSDLSYLATYYQKLRDGIKNKRYNMHASGNKDINDNFLEIASFYQGYNISYGVDVDNKIKNIFMSILLKTTSIIDDYSNSLDETVDIECLMDLLYYYLCFFVEIGVNPKEYLDKYIEKMANSKNHSK